MPRFKIIIEYDGTNLLGWQKQLDGDSVQSLVEKAIFNLTQQEVEVYGAGRTDARVHAFGQVAHFELGHNFDEYRIVEGINAHLRELKAPVSILSAAIVDVDFHARFSATKRSYIYKILNRQAPPVLEKNRVWWINTPLDIVKMLEASKYFLGCHDFSSFRAVACQAKSPIKTIDKIEITKKDAEIIIYIEAKSFLHHQVRNMVGALKEVGIGKIAPIEIKTILEKCNRNEAPATAPACGLYLNKIEYEKND